MWGADVRAEFLHKAVDNFGHAGISCRVAKVGSGKARDTSGEGGVTEGGVTLVEHDAMQPFDTADGIGKGA